MSQIWTGCVGSRRVQGACSECSLALMRVEKGGDVNEFNVESRKDSRRGGVHRIVGLVLLGAALSAGCGRRPTSPPEPPERLNVLLLGAAKADQVDTVKDLLRRGASADAYEIAPGANDGGDTALIIACRRNSVELARILLDAGAHANLRQHGNWSDSTPLVECAARGHDEIVRLLLDRGANVNARVGVNPPGPTALFWTAFNGRVGTAALLLANGAIVDRGTLFQAISLGHVEIVERLLAANGDPRWTLGTGRTVLEEARRSPLKTRPQMIATVQRFMGHPDRLSK